MKMIDDVKQFRKLSISYRNAYDDTDEQDKIERKIKFLVDGTVHRMSEAFNIKLNTQIKKIVKNTRGTLMPAHTFQQIQSRPYVRIQDFMYLHKKSTQKMNGVNIMLDYSGSEWFDTEGQTINNIERIYIQNFLALCISKYMQDASRDKVRVVIHAFSKSPIKILDTDDMTNTSYEGLLVHNLWGSGCNHDNMNLMPRVLKNANPTFSYLNWDLWFGSEHIRDAFDVSLDVFKKMNMNKFITLFLTDGGISEFGYGGTSALKFVEDSIICMKQHSNRSKMSFVFIKTQRPNVSELISKMGISSVEILTEKDYDNSFLNLSNLVNSMIR